MKTLIKSWPIFWLSQFWLLLETAHFGWNITPSSDAEIICDGIVTVLIAMSMLNHHQNSGEQP